MGLGLDVDIDRSRANGMDRRAGIEAGIGNRRNAVAFADADRAQRKFDRIGAIGEADGMRHAAIVRELRLERCAFGAEHIPALRSITRRAVSTSLS